MNIELGKRPILKGLHIGTELECLVLNRKTLLPIDRNVSSKIFKKLIADFGYENVPKSWSKSICMVTKKIKNVKVFIQLESTYAMFEITTCPIKSASTLRSVHKTTLSDFRKCIHALDGFIWPYGVAPYATNMLRLAAPIVPDVIENQHTKQSARIEDLHRLAYICAHQVNLDISLEKSIPTINALYKHLGEIIDTFANAKVYANGMLYNEGRYYWWTDCDPIFSNKVFTSGRVHSFPPHQFSSLQEYVSYIFQGFGYVIREKKKYLFKDIHQSIDSFIKKRSAIVIDENNHEKSIRLEPQDISLFLHLCWLDFKLHFVMDDIFTADGFVEAYTTKKLDAFFKKHCLHTWVEVRPCSVHFENDAMDIPLYFLNIFNNIDTFIDASHNISWAEARHKRDKAIGYS